MAQAAPMILGFNAGELSPRMEGRIDLDKYQFGCRKLENFLPLVQGGIIKRSGTKFVKEIENHSNQARLIPFEFSTDQAYQIEFGSGVLRFYKNSEAILETAIAGAATSTAADPCVITTAGVHGFFDGDEVFLSTFTTATELNNRFYKITVIDTTSFSLQDFQAVDIDASGYGVGAAGTVAKVYEVHLTEKKASIAGITQASPAEIDTVLNHGLTTGDTVWIEGVVGMEELNRRSFVITVSDAVTFTLDGEDSTGYGAWSSGGEAGIQVPWTSSQLASIDYAQSADIMYLAQPDHPPHKISRTGHTAWTVEEIDWSWIPFNPENTDQTKGMALDENVKDIGDTGQLHAGHDIFTSDMVGMHVRLREIPASEHIQWQAEVNLDNLVSSGGFGGIQQVFWDGNVYEVDSNFDTGLTGNAPPIHEDGMRDDGRYKWKFLHPGSGYVKITQFDNANTVTVEVVKRIPDSVTGMKDGATTPGEVGDPITVSGVSTANPAVVTVASNVFQTGDLVKMENTGIDEIDNKSFVITYINATTFSLDGVDGANFSYVGGADFARRLTRRFAFSAFGEAYGYPRTVTFFEDRLWWGGTDQEGQAVWASQTSDYENHKTNDLDQSALLFVINTDSVNAIQWLSAEDILLMGTVGGEFVLGPATATDPITPGNTKVSRNSTYGSRESIQPVRAEQVVLFIQRAGRKLRELVYDDGSNKYVAQDLTKLAQHVTVDRITRATFLQEPDRQVWCQLDDGELVCLTYERLDDVAAWSRHPIAGTSAVVESISVIPHEDGDRDQLWMIVKRTVNGNTVRYVEYLEETWLDANVIEDAFFVDSGLVYSGASAATIVGLDHLEGETVVAVKKDATSEDVTVETGLTVSGGAVTLSNNVTKASIGLSFDATAKTMRVEAGAQDGTAQGKIKRFSEVVARLHNTGEGLFFGGVDDDDDELNEVDIDPGVLVSDDTDELSWPEGYERKGHLVFKHQKPLPCSITSLMPRLDTQDGR